MPRLRQRLETIDIGHYSTCGNGCVYCYATLGGVRLDLPPDSPSLDPAFSPAKQMVDAACRSFKPMQGVLF